MDGVLKADGIYVAAATNRPDLVDAALKRAGRLNRTIEIGLPDLDARKQLFELYLKGVKVDGELDLELLAKATEGNSAADIREICNQAGLHAYQRESELVVQAQESCKLRLCLSILNFIPIWTYLNRRISLKAGNS